MRPVDTQALEAAAWQAFVGQLAEHMAGQWPVMANQLRDRLPAFIDLALQQADEHGLRRAANIARYANLWFVWGPAFQDKPGFDWAKALTAPARQAAQAAKTAPRRPAPSWKSATAPPAGDGLLVHQLVQRSLVELKRLSDGRVNAATLEVADARVVEVFGHLGDRNALTLPAPPPLPQKACDLEATDLRVLDDAAAQIYQLGAAGGGGDWQRVAVKPPAPLRVDGTRPLPTTLAMLSAPPDQGTPARLQLRLRAHALCDQDAHPVLGFSGPHGRWLWQGHEALAASWPVVARDAPLPHAGPGAAIAEETSPELYRLELEFCGLRDEGDAVGSQQAMLMVWPAAQWWLSVQRGKSTPQALLPGAKAWARGPTRCRLETDGLTHDGSGLQRQFEHGLDAATAAGLQALTKAWSSQADLSTATLEAKLGLLTGQAALTWGWQHGPAGLADMALMRVAGLLEMAACDADLQLGADFSVAGARSRIALQFEGKADLNMALQRDTPLPTLTEAMAVVVARWRFPAVLVLDPLAVPSASLLQLAGAPTGALVGEAGLRPCTKGSSGFEWFVALRLEAVSAPLQLIDPLLGQRQWLQPLLPALDLVDWSLG